MTVTQGRRIGRAVIALATSVAVLTGGVVEASAQESPELSWKMKRWINRTPIMERDDRISANFDSESDVPQGWYFLERDDYRNPLQFNSKKHTSIHDGVFDITTKRHCVTSTDKGVPTEPTTPENEHEGPCPAGKVATYTSARVETPNFDGGNFRITVRAKFDADKAVVGVRPSIWSLNNAGWCTPTSKQQYGELDLVEAYSDRLHLQHSVTHAGCHTALERPQAVRRISNVDDAFGNWHEYAVEVFDGNVVYLMDGKVVGNDDTNASDFSAVTRARFQQALNQRWRLIINTLVEGEADSHWVSLPDETKPFPEHHFLIDYILVEHEVDENGNRVVPEIPQNAPFEETSADLSAQKPDVKITPKRVLASLIVGIAALVGLFAFVPALRDIAKDFMRQFPAAHQFGLVD